MNIKQLVKNNGVSNLLFLADFQPLHKVLFISYTSSNDEYVQIPSIIDESVYKVSDGYKIVLKPIIEGFAPHTYYQSDFNVIIKQGKIIPYVKCK